MNFILTEEDIMMRDLFRHFTKEVVAPIVTDVDEEERFPGRDCRANFGKLGMLGIPFPREYGGAGGTEWQYVSRRRAFKGLRNNRRNCLCTHFAM